MSARSARNDFRLIPFWIIPPFCCAARVKIFDDFKRANSRPLNRVDFLEEELFVKLLGL